MNHNINVDKPTKPTKNENCTVESKLGVKIAAVP